MFVCLDGFFMEMFAWNEFLSVGHEAIDEDHKKLLATANMLCDPGAQEDRDTVLSVLDALGRYVGEHFHREEAVLAAVGFPLIDDHQNLHRALTADFAQWHKAVVHRWRPSLGGSIHLRLCEWLIRHIVDEDLRVGFFIRHGRVPSRPERYPLNEVLSHVDRLMDQAIRRRGIVPADMADYGSVNALRKAG